jgi:hypothetical protein
MTLLRTAHAKRSERRFSWSRSLTNTSASADQSTLALLAASLSWRVTVASSDRSGTVLW